MHKGQESKIFYFILPGAGGQDSKNCYLNLPGAGPAPRIYEKEIFHAIKIARYKKSLG